MVKGICKGFHGVVVTVVLVARVVLVNYQWLSESVIFALQCSTVHTTLLHLSHPWKEGPATMVVATDSPHPSILTSLIVPHNNYVPCHSLWLHLAIPKAKHALEFVVTCRTCSNTSPPSPSIYRRDKKVRCPDNPPSLHTRVTHCFHRLSSSRPVSPAGSRRVELWQWQMPRSRQDPALLFEIFVPRDTIKGDRHRKNRT